MNCLICRIPMEQDDSQAWETKFKCEKCKMTLKIMNQDLMSGTLIEQSYSWFDPDGEMVLSYDLAKDSGIINIKDYT